MLSPLLILLVGMVVVLGLILVLRVNAFLALITAAMVVSLLAGGPVDERIARVAVAFGTMAGQLGIPIAMAAIIGKCLMESGAADRIVRAFLGMLGERRAPEALASGGFVLAIPVFFDTVFYLLVPLARSLFRRTGRHYMLYLGAIATGGMVAHSLIPPTPGPLMVAVSLEVDLGLMILVGVIVGLPTAAAGLAVARLIDRRMPIPMRPYTGGEEAGEATAAADDRPLPPLVLSALPIVLPVALIALDRVAQALAQAQTEALGEPGAWTRWSEVTAALGNPASALFLAAVIAMATLKRQRGLSLAALGRSTEAALLSGGVIILITSAGGAFGDMLRVAGVGPALEAVIDAEATGAGLLVLLFGAAVSSVLKIAQGSSTVAMLTTAGIFAPIAPLAGCDPVYLAMAIGNGAVIGSWMNDSAFWVFARMGVLTEAETLKSWTVVLVAAGLCGVLLTLLAAWLVPWPFSAP